MRTLPAICFDAEPLARPRLQCLPRRFDRHYVLAGLRLPNSRVVASRLWRDFPKMAPKLSEPYRRAQFLPRLDRSCGSQISVCFGIRQTLQSRCVLRKFIVTEVAVTSARRQD